MTRIGYDRALLFGGVDRQNHACKGTHVFDWDQGWLQATYSSADDPPYRAFAAMASLPNRSAVMFGGFDPATNNVFDDTWLFAYTDGAELGRGVWKQLNFTSASTPSARAFHGMAAGRMTPGGPDIALMFGGSQDSQRSSCGNDMWIFDPERAGWIQVDDAVRRSDLLEGAILCLLRQFRFSA